MITVLSGYPFYCFQNNSQQDFIMINFARPLGVFYNDRREMTTSTSVLKQLTDKV